MQLHFLTTHGSHSLMVDFSIFRLLEPRDGMTAQAKPKTDAQAFHDAMRKLWEDHITWTRLVIVGIIGDLPAADANANVERLLQNQVDIGNTIKPFYGGEAGDQFTAFLTDHILIAAEILQAAEDGDTAALRLRWRIGSAKVSSGSSRRSLKENEATSRGMAEKGNLVLRLRSCNQMIYII